MKQFFSAVEWNESQSLTIQITKSNDEKVFSILKELENHNKLNIVLSFKECTHIETVKILSNFTDKKRVFDIVRNACQKKIGKDKMSSEFQEIYQMHQSLMHENMSHDIQYHSGRMIQSIKISNIRSYFEYGADRVNKLYSSLLLHMENESNYYLYGLKIGEAVLEKMKKTNDKLSEEFAIQAKEFDNFSNRYKNSFNADMFARLATVRDENQ